ncbi:uncharacterized protein LOC143613524 [Bidens hawaiensis]|uniref:uncharacterized protein LOC143613524 n=1 Tax=Bidens hawaiensis TaxID=980011 RepID=UPI00404B5506
MKSGQYASWSELFRIHCKAFIVYNHLTTKTPPPVTSSYTEDTADPKTIKPSPIDSWERIDAIVLQWIYGTISTDLLNTILQTSTTAFDAWTSLGSIFKDNKASRAVYLKNAFANARLDNFPSMHAYCREIKSLIDQLANVNAPVTSDDMVLQLITGLNEQFEGIAMVLQQSEPLPSFYVARGKLVQEETQKSHMAVAYASAAYTTIAKLDQTSDTRSDPNAERSLGRGRSRGRGCGRQQWGRGRGSGHPSYNNNYTTGPGYKQLHFILSTIMAHSTMLSSISP